MFRYGIPHRASRPSVTLRATRRYLLVIACLVGVVPAAAWAQAFQSGEAIEYKVRGSWPPSWERGVFIRELPGGKQALIYEKPNPYFPKGAETAFDLAELRRPGGTAQPIAGASRNNATTTVVARASTKPVPPPVVQPAPPSDTGPISASGLLSKEEVIAYARAKIGTDPWKNPPRDDNLAQIRDYIRTRGTNFTADADFRARMDAQSSMSSHIGWAVNENRGPHPALRDYFGTWLLRAANRGSHSTGRDSIGRGVTTTTDSQAESGQLTINSDGSYVWQALRGDPEAKWLRGRWREVKPDEPNTWEGGPAIWLLQAKQGQDYMVRMGRDPAWPGWIDVGMGKARTPVEYGRRR